MKYNERKNTQIDSTPQDAKIRLFHPFIQVKIIHEGKKWEDEKKQTNYVTIILPTQQGLTMDVIMNNTLVKIKKPDFVLDYVGDKEGFFIYWLKKRTFLNVRTFYMTAKFYDAEKGVFVKMMNMPQAVSSGTTTTFDNSKFFYYRVELDYEKQTYQVFNTNPAQNIYNNYKQRAGTSVPIKWYEYVNP